MLERGQKLDDLVVKTDKLSGTSKAFYKEVRLGWGRLGYRVIILPLFIPTGQRRDLLCHTVVLFTIVVIYVHVFFMSVDYLWAWSKDSRSTTYAAVEAKLAERLG